MKWINKKRIKEMLEEHRGKLPLVVGSLVLLTIYTCSKGSEKVKHVYHSEGTVDFKNGKILGTDSIYQSKERLFVKRAEELLESQKNLSNLTKKLEERIAELEKSKTAPAKVKPEVKQPENPSTKPKTVSAPDSNNAKTIPGVTFESPSNNLELRKRSSFPRNLQGSSGQRRIGSRVSPRGPSVINFPIKRKKTKGISSVVLPTGSYVKAKLMTGVETPEGRPYPVLLQLDYAYIVPNQKRLDLSGCFMIAKAQGDLSTERVQMQATKLSCVSRAGQMFERTVSGFVADDKDNSFAVIGSVNTKQDRVATMGFLASIVEGVGKAIQQAQTTQTTNAVGGTSTAITGNKMAHIGAGGAANAASMVTQWYLKQAQNLLPTINVGSGQDVWVIMQEKVQLPNNYFKKNQGGNSVYAYFSRILD